MVIATVTMMTNDSWPTRNNWNAGSSDASSANDSAIDKALIFGWMTRSMSDLSHRGQAEQAARAPDQDEEQERKHHHFFPCATQIDHGHRLQQPEQQSTGQCAADAAEAAQDRSDKSREK